MATGDHHVELEALGAVSDGDAFLLEAENNGRIIRIVAGAGAVLALLVIAVSLFPGASPRSGTTVAARAVGSDLPLGRAPATLPTTTASVAAAPIRPAGGTLATFVEPMDELSIRLAPIVTVTVPGEWVEPEVEPESQWIDGGNGVLVPDVLLRIRFCESSNNYGAAHVTSSARGAYQFLSTSWEWYGHAARYGVTAANLATPAQQDEAALLTFGRDGARPWAESRPCWDDPDIDPRYLTARPQPTTTVPATTAPPTVTSAPDEPTTTSATTTTITSSSTSTTATTTSSSTSTTGDTTPVTTPATSETSAP